MTPPRRMLPLLIGGMTLVALDLGRRVFCRTRLFTPSRNPELTWDPTAYGIPAARVEEQWIRSGRHSLHGWYCRAEQPVGSTLFCHGKTGNITTVANIIPHLLAANLNVLVFDYRGFGKSSGRPSMRGVLEDAHKAALWHEAIRPQQLPSLIYGYSLGGGIAAEVISRGIPFDGVVLHSTFTTLRDIARLAYPRLHWLAGQQLETTRVIRQLRRPLLIIHGDADEVVPHHMAYELYEACTAPKKLHIVRGAQHGDVYERDGATLKKLLAQFVDGLEESRRSG